MSAAAFPTRGRYWSPRMSLGVPSVDACHRELLDELATLEDAACAMGRKLLTLDTRAGDAAEPLYRSLGYHEAGRIPGYALNADGSKHDTVLFWKELSW